MIENLLDVARYILGDFPAQYQFLYYVFAFALGIAFIFVVFSPFILAYKMINRS